MKCTTVVATTTFLGLLAILASSNGIVRSQTASPSGPPVLASGQGLNTFGAAGRIAITSLPFTINQCGSYFVASCLTGVSGQDGITVDADNVTIDLNGYTLTGVPGSGAGIKSVNAHSNVTILNGFVEAWSQDGVEVSLISGARVRGVTSKGNGASGIVVGDDAKVSDCEVEGNLADGLAGGEACQVSRCSARNNTGSGLFFGFFAQVEDCSAISNGTRGIRVASRGQIRDSLAYQNGTHGFEFSFHGSIRDCVSNENGGAGIRSLGGDSFVQGNIATSNVGFGIETSGTTTVVTGNQCVVNTGGDLSHSGGDIAPTEDASTSTSPHANFDS